MFACIGWGSLIWCQKALPVSGGWHPDGPELPIEFARESRDKRITLVVCEAAPLVTALWAALNVRTLDEAKQALAAREGVGDRNIRYSIGHWSVGEASDHHGSDGIGHWAEESGVEGVVWTALKPKIGEDYRVPSEEEIIRHLSALDGTERNAAEEYVRLAPRQVATPYRKAIEEALGWTPLGLV